MQRTQERTWAPLAALLALAVALLVALSPAAAWGVDIVAVDDVEAIDGSDDAATVSTLTTMDTEDTEETTNVATVTTSDGTVTSYTDLSSAISAATSGSTVTLLSDVTITDGYLLISTSITLDLGGYTLTFSTSSSYYSGAIYISDGDVTITNGTILDKRCYGYTISGLVTIYMYGDSLTTSNVAIQTYSPNSTSDYNYILYILPDGSGNYPSVTLGSGTTITDLGNSHASSGYSTNGCVGVTILGAYSNSEAQSAESNNTLSSLTCTSLTVEDGVTITTQAFAICGNGAYHGTTITIEGGTITSTGSTGIYHPQYGTLTISGGTITGATSGIEIRAGILTMTGGTVTGQGAPVETQANGNGTTSDGAGIAIAQHTTCLPISVTISGGTVSGYTAVYESNVQENNAESIAKVTISLTGGTYSGGSATTTDEDGNETTTYGAAVYSEDCTAFISGGSYYSEQTDGTDISTTYLSSSAVAVIVSTTDTTYVGTLAEVNEILDEVTTSSSTVTVLSTGEATTADFTVADQATVVNATTGSTVTVNDASVTIAAGEEAESHIIESIAKAATCASTGYADDAYQCTVCGQYFTGSTDEDGVTTYTKVSESDVLLAIDADAHDWDYDEDDISVVWADDYSSVTVTWTCLNDASHTYTDTTSKVYSAENEDGTTTYLAYLTDPDGGSYTVTVTVEAEEDATTADSDDDESELASTGDSTALVFGSIAGMGALALVAGLAARKRRNAA